MCERGLGAFNITAATLFSSMLGPIYGNLSSGIRPEIFSCGIRNAGIWNPSSAHGIGNPTNDWNPRPKFYWQGLRTKIRNPNREIQNPRLSWINLHRVIWHHTQSHLLSPNLKIWLFVFLVWFWTPRSLAVIQSSLRWKEIYVWRVPGWAVNPSSGYFIVFHTYRISSASQV